VILSIITINKNNSEGLKKTIESVFKQDWNDFEFIVIDGSSTDSSIEVIKLYSDQLSYWVSEPDNGIYNAMNKGILKASGEYCLFLNSGDWLLDNVLKEVFNYNFHEDIFYGNVILKCDSKEDQINIGCGKSDLTFYDFYNGTIMHQSAFIKRYLFDIFGLYDESYSIISDWVFFIKAIIFGGATCHYENINISYFDTNGIGTVLSQKHLDERSKVLKSLFPNGVIKDYENYFALFEDHKYVLKELKRFTHRFNLLDKYISLIKKFIV